MYSNVIPKLGVVKRKALAGCFLLVFFFFFFFGFQRVAFERARSGLPFVSVCLFMKSHTVQARGGFKGSGVPSAMFMGQNHLTALTLHRQTSAKEAAVHLLKP